MEDFIKERNEVMLSKDIDKIKAYCEKYDIYYPNEKLLWAGVHKVICELHKIPEYGVTEEQYQESYNWLKDHNFSADIK